MCLSPGVVAVLDLERLLASGDAGGRRSGSGSGGSGSGGSGSGSSSSVDNGADGSGCCVRDAVRLPAEVFAMPAVGAAASGSSSGSGGRRIVGVGCRDDHLYCLSFG